MQDFQTESLWSQVSGKAISGEKEGMLLKLYPSQQMTYAQFKKSYPTGRLLRKPSKGGGVSHYERYFADSAKIGIFDRIDKFDRLPSKDIVVGVRSGDKQAAVTMDLLAEKKMAILNNMSPPVVVIYDLTTQAISGYEISSQSATSIEYADGKLSAGDESWDIFTGHALNANGKDLKSVSVSTAFWFAWSSFFPDTELIM